MDSIKYIGLDVHKDAIVIAVLNDNGKLVMESIIETKASTILQFIQGLRGDLYLTFEEGTWAAWLYDLLKPHVTKVVVCNPRKNALLKEGSKSDKIDARKLAELLRGGHLRPVYHGANGIRTLKELARSYLTISKDLTRGDLMRDINPHLAFSVSFLTSLKKQPLYARSWKQWRLARGQEETNGVNK